VKPPFRIPHAPASTLVVVTMALLASFVPAHRALAQCTWPVLTSGTPTSLGDGATPQFSMGVNYWTAVGSRGPVGDDWDLTVNSGTGGLPLCVSGPLASSTYAGSTVDFVIGDFNSGGNPAGTYYVRSYRYSGVGSAAALEWDDGIDQIIVNDYPTVRTTGPGEVLECWDTYLVAGQTYFVSHGSFGGAVTRVFLFRNPAAAPIGSGARATCSRSG
jgi:hypothetical protein